MKAFIHDELQVRKRDALTLRLCCKLRYKVNTITFSQTRSLHISSDLLSSFVLQVPFLLQFVE